MLGTAAALALVWAMAFPAHGAEQGEPVTYEAAVASGLGEESTAPANEGSDSGMAALTAEQQALMAEDAEWTARVNLYHAGGGGATGNDSLGCRPIPKAASTRPIHGRTATYGSRSKPPSCAPRV